MKKPRRAVACDALTTMMLLPLAACGEFEGLKHNTSKDMDRSTSSADPDGTEYTMSRSCPEPKLAPVTLSQVNKILRGVDFPGWKAADIGASAQLQDRRLVWVFGDTVRSDEMTPRVAANSMLLSTGFCVAQVEAPEKGPVVPDVSSDVVRWPMSVVRLEPPESQRDQFSDVLVVLMSRISRGSDGAFGFTYLGTDAAVFGVPEGGAPQLVQVEQITPDNRDKFQINWGAASMVDGEWLYVYGTRQTTQDLVFGRELYVSRVPADNPESRDEWRYWDGSRWQSDRRKAAAILPAEDGVSQVLSVDRDGGQYVAVSKRGGDVANFVYTWTASSPVGPWTSRQSIPAPAGFDTGELKYAPLAHPEVPMANGNLLVSISRNSTDFERLLAHPEIGRPEFAEVTVPR